MKKIALTIAAITILASPAFAFPKDYPPYKFKSAPFKSPKISPLVEYDHTAYKSPDGNVVISMDTHMDSSDFKLKVGDIILAEQHGEDAPYPDEVYEVDLDNNGLKDYIIFYSYHAMGMSFLHHRTEILLQERSDSYRKIGFDAVGVGIEDFVDLNNDGKYEVILTGFYGGEKHNYFSYSIYEIKDFKLVNADKKFKGFPKFVWFTNGVNDKDTTHLNAKEKQEHIVEKNASIQYESIPSQSIQKGKSLSLVVSSALEEANSRFTYKNKPIHPFLIREFSNWMSDYRPPVVTTVDVSASFDTNKYQQSTIEKNEGWWFAKEEEMDGDIRLYESFDYLWLGKSANDIHVVETGANGGGSGTFMDLIFIKFSEGEVIWESKKTKQLLMTIVGTYSLGDRYEGEIKVYPDKVFIPASKNQHGGGSTDKDVELKFPAK